MQCEKEFHLLVLALKMEERGQESRNLAGSKSWEWPSADSQRENAVLQPIGTEFEQQPK